MIVAVGRGSGGRVLVGRVRLAELMGHRDFKTTLIYADYAPSEREAEWVEEAFRPAAPVVVDSPATT